MMRTKQKHIVFSTRFASRLSPILMKNSWIFRDAPQNAKLQFDSLDSLAFCRHFPEDGNFTHSKTQKKSDHEFHIPNGLQATTGHALPGVVGQQVDVVEVPGARSPRADVRDLANLDL